MTEYLNKKDPQHSISEALQISGIQRLLKNSVAAEKTKLYILKFIFMI